MEDSTESEYFRVMNERSIQRAIARMRNPNMWVVNQYLFRWESDFLEIRKTGLTAEYEIKLSRSDFKAEKNKSEKFSILQNGYREHKTYRGINGEHAVKQIAARRPNYFSYVVPEGLIDVAEVPSYAGLYYVKIFTDYDNNEYVNIRQVKAPKRIHGEKYDLWKELAAKWFFGGYNQKLL